MNKKNTSKPVAKPLRSLRPPPPRKKKWVPEETFPHHKFAAPYSQLLTLGLTDTFTEHEKLASALIPQGKIAADKLVEIALDASYDDYYSDEIGMDFKKETRLFAPLNAVLVLARMGEYAVLGVESLIPLLETENDELREALPEYFAAVGEPALPALLTTLNNAEAPEYEREGVADSLCEIAQKHPELRNKVISELEAAMLREEEQSSVAGYIVGYLLDLDSKESYSLIKTAFEEGRIDEMFTSLTEVEEYFGMEISEPATARKFLPEVEEMALLLKEKREHDTEQKSAPKAEEPGVPYVKAIDVGRNDPCPCGSGKKFKKCHGA